MIYQNLVNLTRNSSEDNEYFINNQKYIIKILFLNPDGSLFTLSKNSLKNLEITDNVFKPFNYSSISFKDNDNSFQRLATNQEDTEFNPELNVLKGYNFRGDGRDFVFIEMLPVETTNQSFGVQDEDYNKIFGYRNLFVCIGEDEKNINGEKIKTYELLDFDEKLMRERKSFFSTGNLATSLSGIPNTMLSNKDREVETGTCIKNLLKDTLLAKTLNQIVDIEGEETPDFETGLSKIFYTSPADNSAYDDLMYLYSKHVSDKTNNDFSILKKDNFTNKFSLEGVSEKFNKAYNKSNNTAGKYNLEKIIITGSSDGGSLIQNDKKIPNTIASFGQNSDVQDINFFNTDSLINSDKIVTKVLNSYNYGDKIFNVDKDSSDIVNARDTFNNNYVSSMKGKNGNPYPNLVLNQTKSLNLGFDNEYSLYGDNTNLRKSESINKLLKSSLVTNLGVEIQLKGQLFRKSGRFISLDREGEYPENLFDKKFLGIYFILNVDHIFVDDTQYFNKILAVKTYIFDNPKFKENLL